MAQHPVPFAITGASYAGRNPEAIYSSMIGEAANRLLTARHFMERHSKGDGLGYLESAALQTRKALESIAFAAISPNEAAYRQLRARADDNKDFTKDYHAKRIFRDLKKVHQDFYPLPLAAAVNKTPDKQTERHWHFDRRQEGCLTEKEFVKVYDRLGKHLHAHNPWDTNDPTAGLGALLEKATAEALALLELHAAFIRTPAFTGVWIVEVPAGSMSPRIFTAHAQGNFIVRNHG